MSRIGKQPIPIPSGVEVKTSGREVSAKGGRGEGRYTPPDGIDVVFEAGVVTVSRRAETRQLRALHGLARADIANLVRGVDKGFSKTLELLGTGYRAEMKGKNLELQLGRSHPVVFGFPAGIECKCESPTKIVVTGADKVKVGQVAANIRALRAPEPYKGKGIRYEGERVRRKAGKSGAAEGR